MCAYADAVAQALADPDPWAGFCGYIERVCAMQAGDRGFANVLSMTFPLDKRFEAERDRAFRGFTELVDRAKTAGELREDFVAEDLPGGGDEPLAVAFGIGAQGAARHTALVRPGRAGVRGHGCSVLS